MLHVFIRPLCFKAKVKYAFINDVPLKLLDDSRVDECQMQNCSIFSLEDLSSAIIMYEKCLHPVP